MDLRAQFFWLIDNCGSMTRNQKRRQRNFIANYQFPIGLRMKFSRQYPNLSQSEQDQVFEALLQYFLACHTARRRMVSMPSYIVDEAWHAFILFTREYNDFCRQAFAYYLHHTPAEAMSTPTHATDGLKRIWELTCRQENIDPKKPLSLPLLFAIDASLQIPNGFIYRLDSHPGTLALGANEYYASRIGCSAGCGSCGHEGGGCGSGCAGSCSGGCGGGCGGD